MVPFAVETFGRWGTEATVFLRHAAGRASERAANLRGMGQQGRLVIMGSWWQQLSCALQKQVAASVRTAAGDAVVPDYDWPCRGKDGRLEEDVEDLWARAEAFAEEANVV